jgi:CheY-like chemotaxis protein
MPPESKSDAVKILVVDDQSGMRLTLKGILVKRGYQVTVAEDGYQALEEAKKTKFSIIFMDIKMPGMSGVETYLKLKEFNSDVTVIMMTAFALEDDIKLAVREGAYAVLHKPFDMEKMFAMISESLDKRPLILVVDDSDLDRHMLQQVLVGKGYKVSTVATGEECVREIVSNRFQVIFLDLTLPGMNGIETLKQVKEMRPDTVVIMVTGRTEKELLEQAMNGGSYACLRKPFDVNMLVDVLKKGLSNELRGDKSS